MGGDIGGAADAAAPSTKPPANTPTVAPPGTFSKPPMPTDGAIQADPGRPGKAATNAAKGKDQPGSTGLEETTAKFNAYIEYMNRTLRAVDSLARYRSWVNMKRGPTGRERNIYGLYAPYDVARERKAAEAALAAPPSLPELDAAMRAYIAANDTLSPVLVKADGYYSRADYKLDGMAGGRELHGAIVADGDAFLAARAKLEAVMRTQKLALDRIRLAAIQSTDGRKARWHVANVMMHGKVALDALEDQTIDMAAFDADMSLFGEAVKGMDDYNAAHPGAFAAFESFPDSLLSHMREVQGRLRRTKGNLRRAAGLDMTFIQSDWNTMVQTSDMPGGFGDR